MSRRRVVLLTVILALVVIALAAAWALPEVARRVALDQIPKLTGRAASIEDVDINPLTGRFALKSVRLAEGEGPEAFAQVERIDGRLSLLSLFRRDIRLRELTVSRPTARVVRGPDPDQFNFSDVLARFKRDPDKKPSGWSVTVDHFQIQGGRVNALDRAVSPEADWSLTSLDASVSGFTTREGAPPGNAELRGQLGAAGLALKVPAFRLSPLEMNPSVTLEAFDIQRVRPYVPAAVPAVPERGTVKLALDAEYRRDQAQLRRSGVRGEVSVEDLALAHKAKAGQILTSRRVAASISEADLLARDVTLGSVGIEAPDFTVTRLKDGSLDIVAATDDPSGERPPAAARDTASADMSAAGPWRVRVKRLTIREGTGLAVDETITPRRQYRLADFTLDGSDLSTSPEDPPGKLTLDAQATVQPGPATPVAFSAAADPFRVTPLQLDAMVAVKRFDLTVQAPYLAGAFAVVPSKGVLDLDLRITADAGTDHVKHARVSGRVRLEQAAFVRRPEQQPFVTLPSTLIEIKEADLLTRTLVLDSVQVEGASLRAVRDERGQIDLLDLAGRPAPTAAPGRPTTTAARGSKPAAPARAGTAVGPARATTPPAVAGGGTPPAPAALPAGQVRRPINELLLAVASGPWQVSVERVSVTKTAAVLEDRAVTPHQEWTVRPLTVEGTKLGTAAGSGPGRLRARGQLLAKVGTKGPGEFSLDASPVRLMPFSSSAKLSVKQLSIPSTAPYVPDTVPASVSEGQLSADLNLTLAQGRSGLSQAVASGTAKVTDLAVNERGAPTPFFKSSSIVAVIKRADGLAQVADLASVEVDGMDVRAVRDPAGIDLMALFTGARAPSGASSGPGMPAPPSGAPAGPRISAPTPGKPPAAAVERPPVPAGQALAPASPPSAPAGQVPAGVRVGAASVSTQKPAATGPWKVNLDRLDLRRGAATFEDRAVNPATSIPVTDINVTLHRLTWPVTGPSTLTASLTMPGGGTTEVEATGLLDPMTLQFRMKTRDAPIVPYDAYFPFAARFRGLFSGDSVNEVQRDNGVLRVASRGTAWGQNVEVWEPGAEAPAATVERFEIRGIDFSWPNYAVIDRVTFEKPRVQMERNEEGIINLRRLFEVREGRPDPERGAAGAPSPGGAPNDASRAAPLPVAGPAGDRSTAPTDRPDAAPGPGPEPSGAQGNLLQDMLIDFEEIAIEGGYIRFLDRSVKPAFSQEMSQLEVVIRDLSNVLGRQRTTMTTKAVVGGDAAFDLRGELSGIGESLRADLVGQLKNYRLPTTNPYADRYTAWVVERGRLGVDFHYRVEGDVITAEHDLKLGGLRVQRSSGSDEVKNRIGLPLGLIVGLLKDSRGDIDFHLPLKASLKDRAVDWADMVWGGIKQVVLKVLAGPFRAIGRAFRGGGEEETPDLNVTPVTFTAGSSVIGPEMDTHLGRVADFLRRSPDIKMSLQPVATEADVESLKTQELTARIQTLQQERKIAEFPKAVAEYFKARNPDNAASTSTVEAQLTALRQAEPRPEQRLKELLDRRVAVARERLTQAEGIEPERLSTKEPPPDVERSGQGRIEFTIGAE